MEEVGLALIADMAAQRDLASLTDLHELVSDWPSDHPELHARAYSFKRKYLGIIQSNSEFLCCHRVA